MSTAVITDSTATLSAALVAEHGEPHFRAPERVAVAYERSCHVLDAVAAVACGEAEVTVTRSAKADKAKAKADNKALAAALRAAGIEPKGEAWRRAKAGEPVETIAADMAA